MFPNHCGDLVFVISKAKILLRALVVSYFYLATFMSLKVKTLTNVYNIKSTSIG